MGYVSEGMATALSELRIPADPRYIVVAKRAVAALGAVAGFDIEAIDDLTIATAQACESAIAVAEQTLGEGGAQLRLEFTLEERRLEIQVRTVAVERHRHDVTAPAASAPSVLTSDLALQMMGLLVDDCRYRRDEQRGGIRIYLTKYRAW